MAPRPTTAEILISTARAELVPHAVPLADQPGRAVLAAPVVQLAAVPARPSTQAAQVALPLPRQVLEAAGERPAPTGLAMLARAGPRRALVLVAQVMRVMVALAAAAFLPSLGSLEETVQNGKPHLRMGVEAAVAGGLPPSLVEPAAVTAPVAVALAPGAALAQAAWSSSPAAISHRRRQLLRRRLQLQRRLRPQPRRRLQQRQRRRQ